MFQPSHISTLQIYEAVTKDLSDNAEYIINQNASDEMYARLQAAGRARKMISYSELVSGIRFECPNISTSPFVIATFDWRGIDRKMIGHELARLTQRTVRDAGCIISSLVVDKTNNAPSKVFFEWLNDIGILPNMDEMTVLSFWAHQVRLTHEFFKTH